MRITSPNEARAISRHVRVSPNKARQVVKGLRGMSVAAAQRQLTFSNKNAATPVLKTLNSAIANAEHNQDLDADDLFVMAVTVDEGPTLKRFQPRAMGRAYRIRKRTSHIAVTVGIPPKDLTADDAGAKGQSKKGQSKKGQSATAQSTTAQSTTGQSKTGQSETGEAKKGEAKKTATAAPTTPAAATTADSDQTAADQAEES